MKLFKSLILLTVLLISCEKVDLTAYEEQGAPSTVRLITRAADGETFDAPLYAYGFNTGDGSLITSRQLSSFCLHIYLKTSPYLLPRKDYDSFRFGQYSHFGLFRHFLQRFAL